jgi:DNA-binding PadR family transcriptional regulator
MRTTHSAISNRVLLAPVSLSDEMRLILISLAQGPNHGYAIAKDIEAFADRRLGPGTLYGAIARLEAAELIQPLPGDARRRPYRLTTAGARALKAELGAIRRVAAVAARRLTT